MQNIEWSLINEGLRFFQQYLWRVYLYEFSQTNKLVKHAKFRIILSATYVHFPLHFMSLCKVALPCTFGWFNNSTNVLAVCVFMHKFSFSSSIKLCQSLVLWFSTSVVTLLLFWLPLLYCLSNSNTRSIFQNI